MIVKANGIELTVDSIIKEDDALVLILTNGITDEQLAAVQSGMLDIDNGYAVYSGYTQLFEHNVILKKPDADDIADMKSALELLGVKKETTWKDAAEAALSDGHTVLQKQIDTIKGV
jgi:hypothetical protein